MILVFLYSLLIFHSIYTVISFHDILLFYNRKRLQYVILKEIIHVHKSSLSYSRLWTCLWWSNVNKHHFTSRNTVVETNTIKFTGTLIVFSFQTSYSLKLSIQTRVFKRITMSHPHYTPFITPFLPPFRISLYSYILMSFTQLLRSNPRVTKPHYFAVTYFLLSRSPHILLLTSATWKHAFEELCDDYFVYK